MAIVTRTGNGIQRQRYSCPCMEDSQEEVVLGCTLERKQESFNGRGERKTLSAERAALVKGLRGGCSAHSRDRKASIEGGVSTGGRGGGRLA